MKIILAILLLVVHYVYADTKVQGEIRSGDYSCDTKKVEKVTLQLAWKHQFQSAGYYMAKEKGFYKKVALNVEIKEYDGTTHPLKDVLGENIEFAVGRSTLIQNRLEGKPVVMLAAIFQHSPVILLSKKREDLQKISDFKNKKIMLSGNNLGLASINAMLLSSGVQQSMYEVQEHTFNVDDLINNKTDAILAYTSNEPFILQQKNTPYTVFSPRDYGFDFYSDILYTSESLIEKKPAMVDAFRTASLEGWKYAMNHPNEAIAVILKKYNTQDKTKEALKFEAKAMVSLVDYKNVEIGNINKQRVQEIAKTYKLMGYVKRNLSLKNLIYSTTDVHKENNACLDLTKEEKKWIATHTVSVGVEQWNPVVFSNNGKDIDGIAGDFLKRIVKDSGLKIKVVNDLWANLLNDFKNKKIDLLPATYFTNKRNTFGLYSSAYFKMKDYVYVQKSNTDIRSLKNLDKNAKKLAIVAGYGTLEKVIKKYPNIKMVYTKNLHESIQMLLEGKVDALYEGGIAVEKLISDELITGIKGFPEVSFKASTLHLFSKKDEPILQSILQKSLDNISPQEREKIISQWFIEANTDRILHNTKQKKEISFIGLMSMEELVVISFLFIFFAFFAYKIYLKSDVLDVKLKTFNKAIITFELLVILFSIYEVSILDRTENILAKAYSQQSLMIQVADKLRQSSDDLTHFARTFAVTQDPLYEQDYLQTLKIRNGKAPRPLHYEAIYWDLNKKVREQRHPDGEKIALQSMIDKLPFSVQERAKLKESEDNSNDLVNLEVQAFKAMKNGNAEYASELLHSKAYYAAKHKIMLPIDEMMEMLYSRTNAEIEDLNSKISTQFKYILFIGLIFILGNIFIYMLLVKKINQPVEYLTNMIKLFKMGEETIEKKSFYDDEIGKMTKEFFSMKNQLSTRAKELESERVFISSIISTSQVGLVVINKKSEVTVWNEAAMQIFGYTQIIP